jgi:hypothetical protein
MSLYARFEHAIEELGMKDKHIFKENLMFLVVEFWYDW